MTSEEMNRKLVKFLPELDSQYGEYPLHFERWLSPTAGEKAPNGEPSFIVASQDSGVKKHYVWGKGPMGPGYYHLLTNAAYINLYSRITHIPPGGCCACFSAAARKEMDEWDDVKRLMYSRSVSPCPDDGAGQQAAIRTAQQTAQAWHHGMQNEQLVLGAAGAL